MKKPLEEAGAAAAKSLQSCPTLCDPIDGSPPGSTIPGILQARILEWVAVSFPNRINCVINKSFVSSLWRTSKILPPGGSRRAAFSHLRPDAGEPNAPEAFYLPLHRLSSQTKANKVFTLPAKFPGNWKIQIVNNQFSFLFISINSTRDICPLLLSSGFPDTILFSSSFFSCFIGDTFPVFLSCLS